MKKTIYAVVFLALLFSSCANEFNKVYKSTDNNFKYEYAKECFAKGKYVRASTLLQGLVTMQKGSDNAQESLYMLGMSEFNSRDYEGAQLRSRSIARVTLREHILRKLASLSE